MNNLGINPTNKVREFCNVNFKTLKKLKKILEGRSTMLKAEPNEY